MLKLIGIGLMIAATTMVGLNMSASLSKRVSELEASLVLLEKMQTYLRYEQTPTDELIEKLATLELFGSLRFLTECRRDMGKGTPFPQAWRAGVNRAKGAMHLSDKDLEAVRGISQIIGMSDAQGQISALDVTQDMLRDSLQEARQKKDTYGRLYRSLGVLSGVGIGIFLL